MNIHTIRGLNWSLPTLDKNFATMFFSEPNLVIENKKVLISSLFLDKNFAISFQNKILIIGSGATLKVLATVAVDG